MFVVVSSFHRVFTFDYCSDPDFASLPSFNNLRSVISQQSLLRGLMKVPVTLPLGLLQCPPLHHLLIPPRRLDADKNVATVENGTVQTNRSSYSSFLKSDASKAIHAVSLKFAIWLGDL